MRNSKPISWTKLSKRYFLKESYDDPQSGIRIVVSERGHFQVLDEDYSLRVSTRYVHTKLVSRDYAIEHHQTQPHSFPHLQFKFATEEIGQFRIRIDIKNPQEYEKAILGFIYKIMRVIRDLESLKRGITNEILIIDEVQKLRQESDFLDYKINEGIQKYMVSFNSKERPIEQIMKLKKNPLLLDFIGNTNLEVMEEMIRKKNPK